MQNSSSSSTDKKENQQANDHTSGTSGSDAAGSLQAEAQQVAKNTAQQAKKTLDEAKQGARELSEEVKQKTAEATAEARREVESRLDQRTHEAAGRLGGVAQALHRTSNELYEQDESLMAEYTGVAADQVERFSHYLEQHNTSDLLREVRRFAGRQPEIFVAGALAAGFMVGRFLKAAPSQPQPRYQSGYPQYQYGQETYQDPYGDDFSQYGSNRATGQSYSSQDRYDAQPYAGESYGPQRYRDRSYAEQRYNDESHNAQSDGDINDDAGSYRAEVDRVSTPGSQASPQTNPKPGATDSSTSGGG